MQRQAGRQAGKHSFRSKKKKQQTEKGEKKKQRHEKKEGGERERNKKERRMTATKTRAADTHTYNIEIE